VEDEDGRVRRGGVDLRDGGQALFRELMFGKAPHHAHPLRRRRIFCLLLQHGHGVGERGHAFPAQFHIIVQPAADDVDVAVDEAGDQAPAAGVDDAGIGCGGGADFLFRTDSEKFPAPDRHCLRLRVLAVKGRDLGVGKDEVGLGHGEAFRDKGKGGRGCGAGEQLAAVHHASRFPCVGSSPST